MTGRRTLFVATALALVTASMLIAADAALEKTVERAKEKRQQDIDKAGATYHANVDRANTALGKAYDMSIAKRKKDDAKLEAVTKDLEALKAGGTPATTDTGDKLLDGAIKRRTAELETAAKAFKAAVDRANIALEGTYNSVVAGYKRKSDARADELTTELATIKAAAVTPNKSESAAAEPKGNGSQELIKTVGDALVNSSSKKVSSKALASQEYVLVYFSASWCGPCRAFTPELVKFHNDYAKKAKFEVILVGSDRSEQDMLGYMSEDKMPWLGVPYGTPGENALKVKHNVRGIPCLVAYDKEGNVISTPGAGARQVLADFKTKLGIKD